MRLCIPAAIVLACSAGDKRESASDRSPTVTPVAPIAPTVSPDARKQPAALAGPSITIGDDETKRLVGIELTYRPGGHGMKAGGGWGASASFELRRDGKTETTGFGYSDESPGELAEVTGFGEAFEISWKGDLLKITHLGKKRSTDTPGCEDAIEREAAAMGLVKGKGAGMYGVGRTGVVSVDDYKDWHVHCAEQSLRVWVSRKKSGE